VTRAGRGRLTVKRFSLERKTGSTPIPPGGHESAHYVCLAFAPVEKTDEAARARGWQLTRSCAAGRTAAPMLCDRDLYSDATRLGPVSPGASSTERLFMLWSPFKAACSLRS